VKAGIAHSLLFTFPADFPEDDECVYILAQLKADAFAYGYCMGYIDGQANR